jgi:hypothetical protein
MKEIHNISEGSTVQVTATSSDAFMGVGSDDIVPWLQEGVTLTVQRIKESSGYGSKIIVKLKPVEGQDIPTWKTLIASTYESWPNGVSDGLPFDADGYTTNYGNKYFDIQEV